MRRQIEGKVVVVTGASSGIGRATALLLAKMGAQVVVAARRDEALEELAKRIEKRGGRSLAVPCEVTDPAAVYGLARAAVDHFGHIDAWVNNAGVYLAGPLEETPLPVFERILDTNFMGYVHGVRATLPYFRRRGQGVIVNVASVSGRVGSPYQTAYCASKFAIRGFSESLRQELLGTGIDICTVMPPSIDTPLWDHAANYSGYEIVPIPPVLSPERVARVIVSCIARPRPEVTIGFGPKVMALLHDLSPRLFGALMSRNVKTSHFSSTPAEKSNGNLFEPIAEGVGVRSHRLSARRRRRRALVVASVPIMLLGWRRFVGPRLNA